MWVRSRVRYVANVVERSATIMCEARKHILHARCEFVVLAACVQEFNEKRFMGRVRREKVRQDFALSNIRLRNQRTESFHDESSGDICVVLLEWTLTL